MTAQVQEGLRFRGQDHGMAAQPLDGLHDTGHPMPDFVSPSTACWRGYVGHWEVRDNRLYLTELHGHVSAGTSSFSGKPFTLTDLFPETPAGGVFADWCTDWLRVPQGEMTNYVHMGYGSEYERDMFLGVHCGRLVGLHEVANADPPTTTRELTPRLEEVFPEDASFIRALHVNWVDHLPRLVYADWLDERNDARGELLRVDLELAKSPSNTDLQVRRKELLETVKDWFWMKLVGCELPRHELGWELQTW